MSSALLFLLESQEIKHHKLWEAGAIQEREAEVRISLGLLQSKDHFSMFFTWLSAIFG